MNLSLKWKIALNMWTLAAFCTIASSIVSLVIIIRNHELSMEQQLQGVATSLVSLGITDYSGLQGFEKLDDFIESALDIKKTDQIISVHTKRKKMMFSSPKIMDEGLKNRFVPVEKPTFSSYSGAGRKYKVLTVPYVAHNDKEYFLQVAMIYPPSSEIVSATIWQALILFVVLSIIAFAAAHMLAKKLVGPVIFIASYLNRLDPAETKQWMPLILTRPGEYLSDIVMGINKLIVRVKRSIYSMSRTSRYLAHELRTPLTILVGESENVLNKTDATAEDYRSVIKSSLEEADRMSNVVSTVLKIANKEHLAYRPVPCVLNVLIKDHLKKWESLLENNIQWENPGSDVIGVLDADLLLQLIDNLIRNIKNHSGSSSCRIALSKKDDEIFIAVEDFGRGMDEDLIEALNENDILNKDIHIGLLLCLEISSICRFKTRFSNKEGGGLLVMIRL